MQIIQKLGLCEEKEAKVQLAMLERKINAVESTSAGRLFDGISAILGIRKKSSFEGEASMALEFAAEAYEKRSGEKKINVLDGQKCLTESADDGCKYSRRYIRTRSNRKSGIWIPQRTCRADCHSMYPC